jgi:hypothetical protein
MPFLWLRLPESGISSCAQHDAGSSDTDGAATSKETAMSGDIGNYYSLARRGDLKTWLSFSAAILDES